MAKRKWHRNHKTLKGINGLRPGFRFLVCGGIMGDMNRLTGEVQYTDPGAGAAILKCALGKLWPLVHEAGEEKQCGLQPQCMTKFCCWCVKMLLKWAAC